jgi:hypothetical protein
MNLLVKFPTRGRQDLFFSTFNKFHDLSMTDQVSYLVSIDSSDAMMRHPGTIQKIKSYPNTTLVIGESTSKADAINRDINEYADEWDILIIAADDTVPYALGWDKRIIDMMEAHYPDTDGVLFFNDGFWGEKLNTQCILGRKYYERTNYIFHEDYKFLWCDNEFMEVATLLGRQTYFDDVIIKHEHPTLGYSHAESVHREEEIKHESIDKKIFERRKEKFFDIISDKKIKIVHLLMSPMNGPYEEKQRLSTRCFDGIKQYVKSYTQQFSFPNRTELPVDTCADPFYVREAPAEDGVWLSYGHYGAYSAHKRAILEEFSEDLDALIVVEGDVVFDISPADMASRFHRACIFAEEHDGSIVTFGNVGYGRGSEASVRDTSIPMGDYTKIDHFVSAHCYMITKKERASIQHKLLTEKWHAWDIWLYWNYDKKANIFKTDKPLVYEPEGFSMIDLKTKEINVRV